MFVYIYIYIYIHTYIHTYIHVHIHLHARGRQAAKLVGLATMWKRPCPFSRRQRLRGCQSTVENICTYTPINKQIYIYIYICSMYIYIYIYIYV